MEWYFKLRDASLSVSDVPNCLENIIKKHETVTDNPPRRIYVNKIDLNYI